MKMPPLLKTEPVTLPYNKPKSDLGSTPFHPLNLAHTFQMNRSVSLVPYVSAVTFANPTPAHAELKLLRQAIMAYPVKKAAAGGQDTRPPTTSFPVPFTQLESPTFVSQPDALAKMENGQMG